MARALLVSGAQTPEDAGGGSFSTEPECFPSLFVSAAGFTQFQPLLLLCSRCESRGKVKLWVLLTQGLRAHRDGAAAAFP